MAPERGPNQTLFCLAIAGLALSIACSDKTPTGPEASSVSSAALQEGRLATHPARPAPRVVAPRPTSAPGHLLQVGDWGSAQSPFLDNRLLTVSTTGAVLRSECSDGVIAEPILLDVAGQFDVSGTYQIQAGPTGLPRPARYFGSVTGQTMTFRVVLTEDSQTLGPFTLTFGQLPQIGYCPIL
jgi:hypothetical protein